MKLVDTKHVKIEVRKTTRREKILGSIVLLALATVVLWRVL